MLRSLMKPSDRLTNALALLSGAVLAFSGEPVGLGVLLFLAPIGWLLAAEHAAPVPDARAGARVGFLFGFGCHVVAFYWAIPLFTSHVPIPLPLAIVFAAILWAGQALPFAAIGAFTEVLHAARLPRSIALALALPLGFECLFMMFPWRPGEVAVEIPAYAQIAELSGASLVDLAIVLAGAGTAEGLRRRRPPLVALGLVAIVAPTAYGLVRMPQITAASERAPVLRVGVVQPNVMQAMKFEPRLAPAHLDNLRRLSADVERQGVDVVVWPETSYPWVLPVDYPQDPRGRRGIRYEAQVTRPIVFGALTRGRGFCDRRNSAFSMDDSGRIVGRADKVGLLPFSEFVPFYDQLTFLHGLVPCPGFAAGVGPQTLEVLGHSVGILNCYEDLIPSYARLVARERPTFLLNLTNDGWFLDTSEPHLHHMATQLRSIETRRELLRVTNTGLSGRIDANGIRREELPVWTRATMVAPVRLLPQLTTPFVEHGDRLTPALMLVACAAMLLTLVRRARGSAS